MIHGGGCPYGAGSQLAAAESFIRAHPGRISFVTIDIGINDIDGCMTDSMIVTACVGAGLSEASTGLDTILAGLRSADGGLPIYGADYYDPFLAAWTEGAAGRAVARQSEADVSWPLTTSSPSPSPNPASLAAVGDRFDTVDFAPSSVLAGAAVPENVARVCAWTWMCSARDLHPDNHGHMQLASAFDTVIDVSGAGPSR